MANAGAGFPMPRDPHRKIRLQADFLFMEYYVYILQSEADRSYYIGYTSNPDERLKKHNSGHSRYTSKKIPWKLIYIEPFANKSEAIVRESF